MQKQTYISLFITLFSIGLLFLPACRGDVELQLSEEVELDYPQEVTDAVGFYLLNEGNMGSNKSTLDFMDFRTGIYKRNIYAEVNPTVPKELGDVGNDLQIYGSKLYAVINCSNKIEVMDSRTAKRIGQIDIPNCRYIRFYGKYAYVTSYAGPVEINPDYTQKGFVAKIDTATLQIVDRCIVGYQPDELAIADHKIYVANSGGYMGAGDLKGYERTVSVIDISTFKETHRIDVDYNLHRICADRRGNLWVSSSGDYKGHPSRLFFIDRHLQRVTDTIPIAVSNLYLSGDSLYIYSTEWSYVTYSNEVSYGIVDTRTKEVLSRNFITDGTDTQIKIPYGILVEPTTKDIYITDAGNYVSPGLLYIYDKWGKKQVSVRTGDVPAHFALLPAIK
ncbi:MAG: YncE family protein [Paludibacteraceae bacterium]